MVLFVDYLQSRSVGEGAKSIYQRFKKVIRYAIEHDVILKDLTYKNVDYSNKLLKFEQNKTKGHSSASGVVIPLNDNGANIKTVASLLGHSGLKHTEKCHSRHAASTSSTLCKPCTNFP